MNRENFQSIQSFSKSKPRIGATNHTFSVPAVTTKRCCLPCKVKPTVVRPVLCSRQLSNHNNASDDSLSTRKQHYVQVGKAWVEHSDENDRPHERERVWERARDYNDHIEYSRQHKAAKLLEFQRDVKLRVKRIDEEKRMVMLQKNMLEIELERKVARKTAFLAQGSLPNASEVTVVGRSDLIVKNTELQLPQADGLRKQYDSQTIKDIEEIRGSIDIERKKKKAARQKLISRKLLAASDDQKDLPGGFWRDTSQLEYPAPVDSGGHDDDVENAHLLLNTSLEQEIDEEKGEHDAPIDLQTAPRCGLSELHNHRISFAMGGSVDEEVRKQEVKQRALLRRLYMDIEREQVKEYKKMRKHLEHITLVKQQKEAERRQAELEAELASMALRNSVDSSQDDEGRAAERKERQERRERESQRYIKALRSLLRERLDKMGVDIPPLCSCGESVWDTHPDLCANNCLFYKNPKAYERALQTLLSSCGEV